MGSTKIINVLKNDQFEDVLDAFKKAEAEEVIFIFPKNSRLAKKEAYFISLANEAKEIEKQITIMTADQNIKNYAEKYGFRFLVQAVKNKKITNKIKKANVPEQTDQEKKAVVNFKNDEVKEVDEVENYIQDQNQETSENEEDQSAVVDSIDSPPVQLMMAKAKTYKTKASEKKLEKLESIWLKKRYQIH